MLFYGMPSIVLNMIVKNESKVITSLLESVKSIIDYWVIVDTGSTDNTKEVIQDFFDKAGIPGEIHDRTWVNFGHNRTEGLKLASPKGDYLLCVDADMIVVNNGFDKSKLVFDAYQITQKNQSFQYNNLRLLKTSKKWQSIGVTHEYYECGEQYSYEFLNTLFINDVGNGGCKADKFERDIKMLRKGLIDEPENSRYMFYLAQSYKDIQDYEKAIEWYEKRVKAGGWEEEKWYATYQIMMCKIKMKKSYSEVLAACLESYSLRPTRIEPIVEFMIYCRENNFPQTISYNLGLSALDLKIPALDQLFIQTDHYEWRLLDEMSIICYYNENHELGVKIISKLLTQNKYPQCHKERIIKNYKFYMEAMKETFVKYPKINKKPKYLAIARAGDESKHETWLSDKKHKNFDLFVAYYGNEKNKWKSDADHYHQESGLKYPWFSKWLKNPTFDIYQYDAIWLCDDDIEADTETIAKMFDIFIEYNLFLAQPALQRRSYAKIKPLLAVPGYKLRYCKTVEAQMPIFTPEILKILKWTFDENDSGWGQDLLWPKVLGHPKNKLAIIDATPVYHSRPLHISDMYTKVLPKKGVTAIDELIAIVGKHGITLTEIEIDWDWEWGLPADHLIETVK